MQCGSCSAAVGMNQKFCRSCGASVQDVAVTSVTLPQPAPTACHACHACGYPAAPGGRFCRRCGEALTAAAPVIPDSTHTERASALPPTRPAPSPRPAPTPELPPREPAPSWRTVNWKLALGLGGILALLGGGAAAYVILDADKSDTTTASKRPEAQRDSPAAPAPQPASSEPSSSPAADADAPTVTGSATETRSTRATAPENTMRRHLQALVDQDYATAFAEFSTGPGGSSEATWAAMMREYDASVAIGSIDEVSRDATGAKVKVSFYTHDSGDAPNATGPGRCAWFHGIVHVVNEGGRWRYEPPSSGQTTLSKNFIGGSDPRCSELLD